MLTEYISEHNSQADTKQYRNIKNIFSNFLI